MTTLAPVAGSRSGWLVRAGARPEAAPLLFLAAAAGVLAATTPAFAAPANLVAILMQVAVVGLVALALNQVIIAGEIDVSVGSQLAACAFVFASVAEQTGGVIAPLAASLAVGLAAGAVNGLLVTAGRVPSIIATLGGLLALRGAVLLAGADGVRLVPASARGLGLGAPLGLPAPLWLLAAALAAFLWIGRETVWGREVTAVGGNARAAAAVGLRAGRVKFLAFLLTGAAVGLAAGVFAGQTGQIQATAATGFELQAIAAVVLGGTRITGGRGSALAPVLGAVLVGVIMNALTLNSVPATFEQLVLGLLILLAISVDALRERLARARA